LGDFNDAEFTHFGVTSRFFKKDGKFFVHTEGPEGEMADYEIKYTFGLEPLQQYLVEFPMGKIQSLTIAWDAIEKRWFHLYPNERIQPDDSLHWTGRYQNWNAMCAECHTTNFRKGYDLETDSYSTSWSEINVSCQACHGPGQRHVEWAEAEQTGDAEELNNYGLLVDYANNNSFYEVDQCAPCHSRRARLDDDYVHYGPYLDDFQAEVLQEGLYFTDGQIQDEVYVYGSFLQSKMYSKGVRCSDCHNPHSLELWVSGNAVCLQCHQNQPVEAFPTLVQKDYDSPEHHFHPEGSTGSECVNCHMPDRTYMVVDPRRDHSFRTPRPDLSVRLGTPNACTLCHQDESAEWAATAVAEWYGLPKDNEKHFGEIIAAGRSGSPQAREDLSTLVKDQDSPAIVRATALGLLSRFGPDVRGTMSSALSDQNPIVRLAATRGFDGILDGPSIDLVASLLDDPLRAVRSEAARVLSSAPRSSLKSYQRRSFDKALSEFIKAQNAMADLPGAHLSLGNLYAGMGKNEEAIREYEIAVEMDSLFLPARLNLANLYNQVGKNMLAEEMLREAIRAAPDQGEIYYSLGLLLAEEERLAEATELLGNAVRLLPGRARIRYNYALALQQLGRPEESVNVLLRANRTDPRDPDIVYALTIFYYQQENWERALFFGQKLSQLLPNEPGPAQLLRQIKERSGGVGIR
jgi:tetratricopeptide (TPR) repeat protein